MAMAVSCSLLSSSSCVFLPAPACKPSSRSVAPLVIECSSRPQKKATAHHVKTRPKKHNPYDKNRKGPTYYPRLPKPPPIWGLDTSEVPEQAEAQPVEAATS